MKRCVAFILLLAVMLTSVAYAVGFDSLNNFWGMSRDQIFIAISDSYDCEKCFVGKKEAILFKNVIGDDSCSFDGYFVFAENMGRYYGLSKVTLILNDAAEMDKDLLKKIRDAVINNVKESIGTPVSETDALTTWNIDGCEIQIGLGRFKNYIGSDHLTLGVVCKSIESKQPTATPKPVQTKKPTATPKPIQTKKPRPTEVPSRDESSQFTGSMVLVTIAGKEYYIHQSFKQLMDSYEDYFSNYIDAMTSGDYFKMLEGMANYIDMIDALDDLEDADLTEAELAYYIAVYARIMQKLALVSSY